MCIDAVLEAQTRKMTSIAITSREFADRLTPDHPSRHPSGKNLYQEADYFINCHLPYGDAVVEIGDYLVLARVAVVGPEAEATDAPPEDSVE